ncbi:bombyxin A-3 homolog [Cydia pomonella]|uniref:Insulin-like peptide 6 n=1 Tax=Cydia pomonella TaxID=82600 RepID=A0A514YLL4_CYDPO|nr:bombyxin A-3 homolog [Cydia pomonella]QDK59903.1 insulin-like peptide 6 [Cydia pomonella]
MNSLHYLFIIMVLLGNNLVALAQEEMQQLRLSDSINKCSHRLSQMIANLCNNLYKIVKRDTRSSRMIDKLVPEDLHEHMKRARLKRWRRVRRQVANECCERPCTVSNLLMYCPPESRVVKEHPDMFD